MKDEVNTPAQTVFFPGLNSLRFFAALAVVLTHIEFCKKLLLFGEGLWVSPEVRIKSTALEACIDGKMRWIAPLTSMLGEIGVVFFFVLSGFLITYLLLKERESFGRIDIKKFYMRRILRIWPLYIFIVLLGFFVLPYLPIFQVNAQHGYLWVGYWQQVLLFLFMLPNLAFAYFQIGVPNIGQLWSIGVEEQYYIIWPWIVGRSKSIIRGIWVAFFVIILLKGTTMLIDNDCSYASGVIKRFMGSCKMECMVLGGLAAYYFHSQNQWFLKMVFNKYIQIGAYATIIPVVYLLPIFAYPIMHVIFSMQFLVVITNIACNPKSLVVLKSRVLNYLGKVSYGIYMYHMIITTGVIYLIAGHNSSNRTMTFTENSLVYICSIAVTILVAIISYHVLEKPWMVRKSKYSTIISGEPATNNKKA
jgi:peptidoglycan/LPS O-acetylase OafA/YrhL